MITDSRSQVDVEMEIEVNSHLFCSVLLITVNYRTVNIIRDIVEVFLRSTRIWNVNYFHGNVLRVLIFIESENSHWKNDSVGW